MHITFDAILIKTEPHVDTGSKKNPRLVDETAEMTTYRVDNQGQTLLFGAGRRNEVVMGSCTATQGFSARGA